jgi:pseudouridine kinase
MLTPNSTEAAAYCDQAFEDADQNQAIEAAKHLVSQGVEIVIITLAEFGVCYATSTTSGFVPAIHTEIIDPTGAGDALSSTVIFGLLNDIPLDDAIRLGVSAASLTLRHRGAVIPDLSLEKLYDQLVI